MCGKEICMNRDLSKAYIGACMKAKRTTNFLPEPPEKVQRRHILILKIIHELAEKQAEVKISDVARKINVTLPSVTKNINELDKLGYLEKVANSADKRIVNIVSTPKGDALYQQDVVDWHEQNAALLQDISEADLNTTIATIGKIYDIMRAQYGAQSKEEDN